MNLSFIFVVVITLMVIQIDCRLISQNLNKDRKTSQKQSKDRQQSKDLVKERISHLQKLLEDVKRYKANLLRQKTLKAKTIKPFKRASLPMKIAPLPKPPTTIREKFIPYSPSSNFDYYKVLPYMPVQPPYISMPEQPWQYQYQYPYSYPYEYGDAY